MRKPAKTINKRNSATVAAGLLTSAAATLLPRTAAATSFTEGADFPNSPSIPSNLAPGVDSVTGTVRTFLINEGNQDEGDFFVFTGLTPGAPFTLQITYVETLQGPPATQTLEWLAQPFGDPVLDSVAVSQQGQTNSFTGVVPLNGDIEAGVEITPNGDFTTTEYRVDLLFPANGVPDSGGTMMLMGAAVAGLALAKKLKRRRKKA